MHIGTAIFVIALIWFAIAYPGLRKLLLAHRDSGHRRSTASGTFEARSARIDDKQRRGGRRVQLVLSIEQAALYEPDTPTDGYNPSFRSDFSGFKGVRPRRNETLRSIVV
jgi:hypothetical protein